MQEVSEAWKEAHKQMLLPETFVKIEMNMVDTNAIGNGPSFDGTNMRPVQDNFYLRYMINYHPSPGPSNSAWLEYNHWLLDGSIFPIVNDPDLYRSSYLSVDDNPCSLTISFSVILEKEIPGFTISWGLENEGYATDFTVTVENNDTVVASTTITGNTSSMSVVDIPCSEYNKVTVEVSKWSLPHRRARIRGITFGHRLGFDKNNILSYTHEQVGDPQSFELSTNRINFVLDNTKTNWDMINPGSVEKLFFNQQKIFVEYGMDVGGNTEWIKGGTFYLSEWAVSPDGFSASFTADNIFTIMRDRDYERKYLFAVANNTMNVYPNPDDWSTTGYIVSKGDECTIVDLVYVHVKDRGYYTMACFENSSGERWWANFNDATFTILYHSYTISELVWDALRILSERDEAYRVAKFSGTLEDIQSPYFIENTSVPEVLQKCANLGNCGLWQNRKGELLLEPVSTTLTDYKIPLFLAYSYPKIELTKALKEVEVVGKSLYSNSDGATFTYSVGDIGETVTIESPYLVDSDSKTLAEAISQKYAENWKSRKIVSGEFRADPRLDLFDVITVETKYGDISPVMITNIKYTYNGAFNGTYTGRVLDLS